MQILHELALVAHRLLLIQEYNFVQVKFRHYLFARWFGTLLVDPTLNVFMQNHFFWGLADRTLLIPVLFVKMLWKLICFWDVSTCVCLSNTKLFANAAERKLAAKILEICLGLMNHPAATAAFKNVFSICRGGQNLWINRLRRLKVHKLISHLIKLCLLLLNNKRLALNLTHRYLLRMFRTFLLPF